MGLLPDAENCMYTCGRNAGNVSPPPKASDPDMHHGTCVTHAPWCMTGSLTSGFLWSPRRGKTFLAFPAHVQPAMLHIWQEAHEHLYLFRLKCRIWYPSSMFVYHYLNFCGKWPYNQMQPFKVLDWKSLGKIINNFRSMGIIFIFFSSVWFSLVYLTIISAR